jgi:hypothetical protein
VAETGGEVMNYGHGYKPKGRTKYGAKKVKIGGQKFDSQKEADRWQDLKWMERAGLIRDLKRQVHFQLTPTVREPDTFGPRGGRKLGKVILPSSEYVADFTYIETSTEKFIVEDVKGYKTPEYMLKKKFLYHLRGILIYET